MNTLKSAALLVVLLGVLYGVYVALSQPEPSPAERREELAPPLIEYGAWNGTVPSSAMPAGTGSGSGYPQSSSPSPPPDGAHRTPGTDAFGPATAFPSYPSAGGEAASAGPVGGAPVPNDPVPRGGLARSTYEVPASSSLDSSLVPTLGQVPPLEPATRSLHQSSGAGGPEHAAQASLPGPTAGSGPAAVQDEGSPADANRPAQSPALAAYAFKNDLSEAQRLVEAGKFRSALAKLTPHYHVAALGETERATLLAWLDALAGKVIYSREHWLAPPHQVRTGETLFTIADRYHVSHRLLQAINHREVSDPLALVPGIELKVVPGPFRAEVDLTRSEITVFVQDLYGGRFPFTLGDQPPPPGEYQVVDKQAQQRSYYGLDGRIIPANDPANPYGGYWISLGGEVCIHGSPAVPSPKPLGCISLSPQDARDVYSILSLGSPVKILR